MLKKSEYWIVTGLALIALVLALTNMAMFAQNRKAQAEISARAQYIQQSAQLEPLYREMVKALADLSIRNNDVQLRELLAKQGITVPSNAAFGPNAPPGSAAATRIPANEARKGAK